MLVCCVRPERSKFIKLKAWVEEVKVPFLMNLLSKLVLVFESLFEHLIVLELVQLMSALVLAANCINSILQALFRKIYADWFNISDFVK
jgi:hypothetical protein